MDLKVKIYRDTSGTPFPLIVEDGVFPACLYLNAYLNGNHNSFLSRGNAAHALSLNTLISYAHQLKFCHSYFKYKNIDLVKRVAEGTFLSTKEIDDFIQASKMPLDVDSNVEKSKVVRITDHRIQKAVHATINSSPHVSAHTFRQKLIRLRSYVEYLYVCHHYDNPSTSETVIIDSKFRAFQFYLNKHISDTRKDNVETRDPFVSVLPVDHFFNLLEIIKVNSPQNPFKSSRFRNQLVMQILVESGVRIGAVLKLKISDLVDDWDNPRFLLTRTPNDTTDKRRIPAKNKTKALSVSISPELMKLIKLYIDTVRVKYPKSTQHDFLFVAEKGVSSGKPITYEQVYKVVSKFGDAINFKLHPHLLRHKWNEVFTENAESAGYDQALIEDMRKYAMGWVENSKMVGIYNEFKIAVTVRELSAANQNKTVPDLGNSGE
ncbi:TPA: site-specific integrase [Vibrio parahaemolyticus]